MAEKSIQDSAEARVKLLDCHGRQVDSPDLVSAAVKLLAEGKIIAIRGSAGFHLACDATNEEALNRLREKKSRHYKPFALMSQDVETVKTYCKVSGLEKELLQSKAKPVVLLHRKDHSAISGVVSPGLADQGVMLPSAPLNRLVATGNFPALAMASGSPGGEPAIASSQKAIEKLKSIADYFLVDDAEVPFPAKDSIVKVIGGKPLFIRRARGYAPSEFQLPKSMRAGPDILAVGGGTENTVCLVKKSRALLSQNLGDLQNAESFDNFQKTIAQLGRLKKITPEVVAHDLNPKDLSTSYALGRQDVHLVPVQHHFAHVASCMAEHGETGRVLGVVYDSMGYGADGTIWGAEFLSADPSSYKHLGRLAQFRWPGGERAELEPWRAALAFIYTCYGYQTIEIAAEIFKNIPAQKLKRVYEMIAKGLHAPLGSSMGRLFDAVAAVTGICTINNYEGQAPMMLESTLAQASDKTDSRPYLYEISEDEQGKLIVETTRLVYEIVEDVTVGKPVQQIAVRFHETVAAFTAEACRKLKDRAGTDKVVLTGGVFQNRYLTERLVELLQKAGFTVLTHSAVPPNDAGISLGQAFVARARNAQ